MLVPVILAGGSGSRLWPLSRELFPKQLLTLIGKESLLQMTCRRALNVTNSDKIIIVCNVQHRFLVAEQLQSLNAKIEIILEPLAKNTAPAVTLAALHAPDDELLVLPADHLLDETAFKKSLKIAHTYAAQGKLATFGIQPTHPETGYGYIKAGNRLEHEAFCIDQFIEKPSAAKAEEYYKHQYYYWNSGMFLFNANTFITELKASQPDIYHAATGAMLHAKNDLDFIRPDTESFAKSPSDSIDYAVMEKTSNGVVIPLDAYWSDIGSFDALYEAETKDANHNFIKGDVITQDVTGSYIRAEHHSIAAIGLEDVVIVEASGSILVAPKNRSQDVKSIVQHLKKNNSDQVISHNKVYRPWGTFETLNEGPNFKVKRISVKPGGRLSLQSHQYRSEHWVVVKGHAHVIINNVEHLLSINQSIDIPLQAKHRLENRDDDELEIIEIQTGTYLGEDDIKRYEDYYGRCEKESHNFNLSC